MNIALRRKRNYMKPKRIEKQFSVLAIFVFGFYIAIASILLASFLGGPDHEMGFGLGFLSIALGIMGYQLLRYKLVGKFLQKRSEILIQLSVERKWKYQPATVLMPPEFGGSSLLELSENGNSLDNYVKNKDWSLVDVTYSVTDRRGWEIAKVYYTAMAMPLPRVLPNVLFDSNESRKKQFRFKFKRSQRHSLEGNFDKYFTTYFPEDYTVDSLSFITPEVMEALVEAHEYDIEIVGNKVILYGSVFSAEDQSKDMSQKLVRIKKKLLHNIITYRDERLPYELGRKQVTASGMTLKKSTIGTWIAVILITLYIIGNIIEAIGGR
jgi:hypothetical protein